MQRRIVFLGTLSLLAGLASGTVQATESGVSFYIPGLRGPLAGVVPPPGFYFQNDFYSYSGTIGGGRRNEIGGAVLANLKQEARIDFATPLWVTPWQILGGNVAFAVTVLFGVPRVSAGALIEAPRLGRRFRFSQRDATFNLGDPIAASFVGWHAGNFHWSTGVSVNVPAGAYEDGELSNVALNRWVGDVYGALTWLDPARGLDLSGAVGFEINGENPATDYNSGNAVHVDLAVTQFLSKELSVGLLASHYQQVSGDGGSGDRLGAFKGRVTAVGGTIGYDVTVAGVPVSTRLKVMREVEVENRFRGTIGLFTVSFPIGGNAPPSTQSTSAKD